MKKCLVTGSTGFIGSRLVKFLDELKYEVLVLSRQPNPDYESIICDLEREEIPHSALENVDIVFHLAGLSHDTYDASEIEYLYRKINVDATIRLANASAQKNIKQFVFVSSVKAGGHAIPGRCMTENEQSDPEGVYGKTKRVAELELTKIGNQSNMHVSIVRPSLVYGPDVKGNLGMMLAGIKKGWFPPLPETGNHRSMIHVDDLVKVLLLVVNNNHANGEIFIATDGNSYSSRKIYEIMCCVLNKSIPKWSIPRVFFDIVALMGSSMRHKVDKLLGDECYSSGKLELMGFKAQKTLENMNRSSFS